jgi:hypothetical protein
MNREYRYELAMAYNNAGWYYGGRPPTPLLGATAVGLFAWPQTHAPWLTLGKLASGTPGPVMDRTVAEALHRKAIVVGGELVKISPDIPDYRSELASAHLNLGLVLARRDRAAAAREWEQARTELARLVDQRQDVPGYRARLGMVQGNLGWVLAGEKHWWKAVENFRVGIGNLRVALKSNPADPDSLAALRGQYPQLAGALLALKDHAGAAKTALELAAIGGDRDCYIAARYLARCAGEVKAAVRSREYADTAMKLLQQARSKGYTAMAEPLRTDEVFAPLRQRDDFQRLLAELTPDKSGQR